MDASNVGWFWCTLSRKRVGEGVGSRSLTRVAIQSRRATYFFCCSVSNIDTWFFC